MKEKILLEENLNESRIKTYSKKYEKNKINVVVRNALSVSGISSALNNNSAIVPLRMKFNVDIETMTVCNQKNSGRCWIFAGLNVLREIIGKKLGLSSFEFSQNYIAFYDKLEKTNFALCSIIDLIDEKPDDRVLMHILSMPVSDGGQWDMFVNLVNKYGLCPKDVFDETYGSSATNESNSLINFTIRKFAKDAQKLHEAGKDDEISALKDKVMEKIYSLLCNTFGVPPKSFTFEYLNKKKEYVAKKFTPKSFFNEYIGDQINDYVSLINSPTKDKPFNKTYTIDYLGNVVEGKKVTHLNVPMERLEELVINQLKKGLPVWFGSDVSFYRNRNKNSWDVDSLNFDAALGLNYEMSKEDMLDYHASVMNHAMVITGVNLVKNLPTKWKIENSWGSDIGENGYFVMSPKWFDAFTYQAVVRKEFLNEDELSALKEEPKVLAPWDPMGTLAD